MEVSFFPAQNSKSEARAGTLALWGLWEWGSFQLRSPRPSGSSRQRTAAVPTAPLRPPGKRKTGTGEGQPCGNGHSASCLHVTGQN